MDRTTHLIIVVLLAVFLVAIGTAGYMVIEDWTILDSLYMTVITLSTIGYGEVNPVSQTGRIFTLFLIVMGVGFFLYVIGNVVQFLDKPLLFPRIQARSTQKNESRSEPAIKRGSSLRSS